MQEVMPASTYDSLDELQHSAFESVLSAPKVVSRGMPTREVIGASFVLRYPRRRCITVSERRWRLPLAIGEFCWHASGSDDVASMEYYSSRWREFSDDSVHIAGSCYGRKIFHKIGDQSSQWTLLLDLLRREPTSRRAVLNLSSPGETLNSESKDVACATALQFVVRDGQVHAIATMRSNDVVWGLPYDVFVFTMIQELLAVSLELDVGMYYHNAGSLHIYERHLALARAVLEGAKSDFEMPQMQCVDQLPRFLHLEAACRLSQTKGPGAWKPLHPYWQELGDSLRWFHEVKAGSLVLLGDMLADSYRYKCILDPMIGSEK